MEYRRPAGARICRESPLGRNRRSVRRRTRPDRRVAVRPQTIAIRKNRQAAFGLPEPPVWPSLPWRRCGVRLARTPPTRPSDRYPHGPLTRSQSTMIQRPRAGSERQGQVYWIRERGIAGCGAQTSSSGRSLERGATDQRDGAGAKARGATAPA